MATAIKAAKADFWRFARLLYCIYRDSDADATEIKLVRLGDCVKPAQRSALLFFIENRFAFFLKARRLGLTTILAAWFFWRWMFTPNLKIAVIGLNLENAEKIFDIYRRFYDNLPDWMRELFYTVKSSTRSLKLWTGAEIRVYSANTEAIRGDGYNIIHATEVGKWKYLVQTLRSAFMAADGRARIVLETSANGPNEVHRLWNGVGEFARAADFAKLFLGWMLDDAYRMTALDQDYIPPPTDPEFRQWELDYQAEHGADDEQMNWLRWFLQKKCLGSVDTFNQEMPSTADMAFLLSGAPFFRKRYADITAGDFDTGPLEIEAPRKWTPYLMGIDTAAGSPTGDFSAAAILRRLPEGGWTPAWTFYDRIDIHPFQVLCLEAAKRYNAFVNPEPNNHGAAVVQHFKHGDYPYLYRTWVPAKVGTEWIERLGYNVSESTRPQLLSDLQLAVNSGALLTPCARFKHEANSFSYDKRGRPDHMPGCHSDMVFAYAHAIAGDEQAGELYFTDANMENRPANAPERIQYEIRTGKLYSESTVFGDDKRTRQNEPSLSAILSSFR